MVSSALLVVRVLLDTSVRLVGIYRIYHHLPPHSSADPDTLRGKLLNMGLYQGGHLGVPPPTVPRIFKFRLLQVLLLALSTHWVPGIRVSSASSVEPLPSSSSSSSHFASSSGWPFPATPVPGVCHDGYVGTGCSFDATQLSLAGVTVAPRRQVLVIDDCPFYCMFEPFWWVGNCPLCFAQVPAMNTTFWVPVRLQWLVACFSDHQSLLCSSS